MASFDLKTRQPVVTQKAPYKIDIEAGKTYWWCQCGLSKNQPFCDGSHSGTGIEPLKYEATESKAAWFCGCKNTKKKPFCDGSHSKIPDDKIGHEFELAH
eukprot:TRINITY_DN2221_c0_g2_i1.p2 TRINITY_DN2221_c0_g2~~TRINITY_DN2221_c0_g2_i1.p2  ORF type:complete len:100 (-),score=29.44 TRINITY_DN2221_c0_g2_i1:68-367(-)